MADWVKTGQAVPLWYEVRAEFSDEHEAVVEAWSQEKNAKSAAISWKEIERLDREAGKDYTVTVTVTPKYTPIQSYIPQLD